MTSIFGAAHDFAWQLMTHLAFYSALLGIALIVAILAVATRCFPRTWQKVLVFAVPVGLFFLNSIWQGHLAHLLGLTRTNHVPTGPIPQHYFLPLNAAAGIWIIAVGLWAVISKASSARPITIHDLAANPDRFDFANLEGAARFDELKPTDLLIPGRLLSKRTKSAPEMWGWPDPKLYPDRLILGRFYGATGGTGWFVAPHIARMNQTLIVAPPGSGKTFSFAVPWSEALPAAGHSAFVIDIKGNVYSKLKPLWSGDQGLYYFDPTNPSESLHWNPFEEIERTDPESHAFYQTVNDLAEAIFGKIGSGEAQHWDTLDQRAIKAGIILLCLAHEHPALRDLYDLFDSEEGLRTAIEFLRQRVAGEPGLERLYREVKRDLDYFFGTPKRPFAEATAGIRNRLEILGSPAVAGVTDASQGFTLKFLQMRPSVFICATPLSLGRVGSTLAAIVLRMVGRMMVNRFTSTPTHRLFLILDEFSKLQMSHEQMEQFISASREAGCVSVVILQDVSQVEKEARAALLANCKDRFILRGVGTETAKWGVELLGERVRYQVSSGHSESSAGFMGVQQNASSSVSVTEQSVPVIKPREIMGCGGLRWGAWAILSDYSPKPILVDLARSQPKRL